MLELAKKLSYLVAGLMLVAYVYHYINKNHPNISLPYQNEIFHLENRVLNTLNKTMSAKENITNSSLQTIKNINKSTDIKDIHKNTRNLELEAVNKSQ